MHLKKLIMLSILLVISSYVYPQNVWSQGVFLDMKEKPLDYILNEIRKQTDLNIIFNTKLVNGIILTCKLNSSVENVISELLTNKGFSYKKFNDNSAVIYKSKSFPKKVKAVVQKPKLIDKPSVQPKEISKPVILSKIDIKYPLLAINERIEGTVRLNLLISTTGTVSKVKIEKSSGHKILDTATVNYVRNLKFLPAKE